VSEAQLSVLNYALLALLYLFFARVLWAVWSEVRGPRPGTNRPQPAPAGHARIASVEPDTTAPAPRPPSPAPAPDPVPAKGRSRRGLPSRLVVMQPKVRKGAAYAIESEITLGRSDSCTIELTDDTYASQLHARVFHRDGAVWAEDLGSTNGTHLNGARLTAPQQINIGDRLQVGSTIFEAM
jgi:pSer/pThr/pTyr-binding forkhead associated (FHA) protein